MRRPHALLGSACAGLAFSNAVRASDTVVPAAMTLAVGLAVLAAAARPRLVLVGLALALGGWWWGSMRLAVLDRSALTSQIGRAQIARVVVTAPPRQGRFQLRVIGRVSWFGRVRVDEPVLLELPLGRAPPQGRIVEALATVEEPRRPADGFDERAWLRRQGVHVVLHASRWRSLGARGGPAAVPDRLRAWLGRGATAGLGGERRALVAGVVLGDDQGLSEALRDRFRASGLYHLLAVSGQNVVLVAGGTLVCAWFLGLPRLLAQFAALLAIVGYVAAVGAQPSVIRAGIAGVLGSLAWITARERERWYALLLGALVLLAWNPYLLLDPGFQLSFAAVAAIFRLAPPIRRALDGYPLPAGVADVVAISTACGAATAPIAWLQFHAVPLLSVPANLAAAPAVPLLLGLALAAAVAAPVAPAAAAALAWMAGWCAAYVAACAHAIGALPLAQVRSGRALAAAAGFALLAAAYACRSGERAEAGLPPHRQRPAEDQDRARATARPFRS
jgi:competence protein ComEC